MLLFKTIFGSQLYGTNLPSSDTDFKGIYIPDARDILLQNVPATSINVGSKQVAGKNTALDTDIELYTLGGFFRLCRDGQTNAVEMLFTPKSFWTNTSPEWEYIVEHRNELIHSGTSAFVGYCKTQAAKYCTKGNRVIAAKLIVDWLKSQNQHVKLSETDIYCFVVSQQNDEIKIVDHPCESGLIPHLVVCNKMCPIHFVVKEAFKIYNRIYTEYGARAKASATNDGVDWKSLMHAVRIAQEAVELLRYGVITLPRPNADLLKRIRVGDMAYEAVQGLIEQGLSDVLVAHETSTLPKSIDIDKWTEFTESLYAEAVISRYLRK